MSVGKKVPKNGTRTGEGSAAADVCRAEYRGAVRPIRALPACCSAASLSYDSRRIFGHAATIDSFCIGVFVP